MERLELDFVAEATGGVLKDAGAGITVEGVGIDSREIGRGELFFAIVGERFDAHEFLDQVIERQAGACVVEASRLKKPLEGYPHVLVDDTQTALQRLASRYRLRYDPAVIAVTGSNGKTSTKAYLNTLLSQRLNTCYSPRSFNNHIGVPLSLLQIEGRTEAAVFEAGTNHPGEIEQLVNLIKPGIGVLTFVGRSHLEFFGSVEAVADEKAALAAGLPANGVLFVNGDLPVLDRILARTNCRAVKVGFGPDNDWRIGNWSLDREGTAFDMASPRYEGTRRYRLPVLGSHHLINVGLAAAVGAELGLGEAELIAGVANCGAEKLRMEWGQYGGVAVIADCYNANADSTVAALKTLRAYPVPGERYCVLGDMGELGEFSAQAHEEVGRTAAESGLDHLIGIGRWAGQLKRSAQEGGIGTARVCEDWSEAGHILAARLQPGDAVLVKASRSVRLDRLVDFLRNALQGNEREKTDSSAAETEAVSTLTENVSPGAGKGVLT